MPETWPGRDDWFTTEPQPRRRRRDEDGPDTLNEDDR